MSRRNSNVVVWRFTAPILVALASCLGCGSPAQNDTELSPPTLADDELLRRLDAALDATYERRLSIEQHAAWQILHGALAYGQEFRVEKDGQRIFAIEHLLNGGQMSGWTVEVVKHADGSRGLRAQMAPGTKQGQGHWDQWLAILAQCGLPPSQTIRVGEEELTIAEYIRQVQRDVPRNLDREFSWTLIGLTTYLRTDAEWTDSAGKSWTIAELVEVEADYPIGEGACGGTHRLIGLSMALNRHLAQEGLIEGPWASADERVREAIERARRYQNSDGSFSSNYLDSGAPSADLAEKLGTTGHVLEFLALAMTEEQLREPWVKRAALRLCEIFDKTRDLPLECGALYHAAHGLALYRERLFGSRKYATAGADS